MKVNRYGSAEPLTKEEFSRVLKELKSPHHRLIFALCWYLCERPGAILKLTVDQVYDPIKRTPLEILVIPALTRKDRRTREVPCSRAIELELKAYKAPDKGYLFPGRGGKPLCYRAYYGAVMRAMERLGLRGYTPYSTRHGSLTHLSQLGFNTRQIQAVSGHTSLQSLQRYVAVSPKEKAVVMGQL